MADQKPNVAALIAQMPDTDQQKLNPAKPDAANIASKFTGPEPEAAEKVFTEIFSGGRESILELLAAVRDPADSEFKDYKAGYVLHGLCLFAGRQGKEEQRRLVAESIGSLLKGGSHSAAAKRIFIRELQVVGGNESAAALGACLSDSDLCDSATQALLAIRDGAAEPLRKALADAKGPCLIAITQALGVLKDKESLASLRKVLTHEDPDARRTAAWALANNADAESADAILKFTDATSGWERTHATGICHVLAEKLFAAGQKEVAVRIYTHLRDTRKEPDERHVSEAAARALKPIQ